MRQKKKRASLKYLSGNTVASVVEGIADREK